MQVTLTVGSRSCLLGAADSWACPCTGEEGRPSKLQEVVQWSAFGMYRNMIHKKTKVSLIAL